MSLFSVVCTKSCISRLTVKNASWTLPCFVYRANRDSELGFEITPKLFLTLRI